MIVVGRKFVIVIDYLRKVTFWTMHGPKLGVWRIRYQFTNSADGGRQHDVYGVSRREAFQMFRLALKREFVPGFDEADRKMRGLKFTATPRPTSGQRISK